MKPIRHSLAWVGAALVLSAAVGCGNAGNAKVYPVKGRVTFNGKSMAGGGSIAFVPKMSQAGKTAGGEIKADGTYTLMTYKSNDGSMIGEFRVVIVQSVDTEPPVSKDGEPAPPPTAAVAEADRIPPVYSDQFNSPLTAKVEAKRSNEINFDLQPQAAEAPRTGA